jgi:hypothetical protein
MPLNGPQRIGVVLSVVWALGTAFWQRESDLNAASEAQGLSHRFCLEEESQRSTGRDCLRESTKVYALTLDGSWEDVMAVSLVPIAVAWGIGYRLIALGRWIKVGFKKEEL